MCCMNLSDHSKSIHENIRQLKESVNKLGEVLLTTEAAIRTKERGWIHASRIKGPVDEPKEWTITSEPGDTKLTLKRGLGDAANPFQYDWCHLRVGGLVVAAVLSVVGIIVLFSGKCKCRSKARWDLWTLRDIWGHWGHLGTFGDTGDIGHIKDMGTGDIWGHLGTLGTFGDIEVSLSPQPLPPLPGAVTSGRERSRHLLLSCPQNVPKVSPRREVTQGLGDNGVMMAPDDHMTLLDPHGSVMTMMDPHDLMTSIDPHDPDGPP
ncbi:hypothetical protein DUI87_25715 [Hirundo rustica rustica]|uniref:FXYD domain-containing ion transport regulator n=1 Tax=Hirundo rustica rustica TaxID=333673 RepID=A0A3M0JS89_HIRRU|nr:hypothetical protein DUI87_25715 [Hirundo rustica rustica]